MNAQEKHLEHLDNLPQNEVAKIFGVSTTTVQDWQHDGLPYKKSERGKPSKFCAAIVMFWKAGRNMDKKYSLNLSPLERIVFDHFLNHYSASNKSYGDKVEYLGLMKELVGRVDFEYEEALLALGKVKEIIETKGFFIDFEASKRVN